MPAVGTQIKVPTVCEGSTEHWMLDLECHRKQALVECTEQFCGHVSFDVIRHACEDATPTLRFPNITTML